MDPKGYSGHGSGALGRTIAIFVVFMRSGTRRSPAGLHQPRHLRGTPEGVIGRGGRPLTPGGAAARPDLIAAARENRVERRRGFGSPFEGGEGGPNRRTCIQSRLGGN